MADWSWLAMFVLGLLCSCTARGAESVHEHDRQAAVCRITNQVRGVNNLGSGTLIDKTDDGREGIVLTCAHLFSEGTGQVLVHFANGKSHYAKVLRLDSKADLAALVIGRPAGDPVAVKLELNPQGRLYACGYGPQGVFRCAVGRQVGQAASPGQISLLLNDPVRSGDSGGGVFDEQGNLVAVIWGKSQDVTYASYGRPLQEFLSRVLGRRTSAVYRCPGGVCAPSQQRPVAVQPWLAPLQETPKQLPQQRRPSSNWKTLQRKIDELSTQKQDRGDYLTRNELPEATWDAGFALRRANESKEKESGNFGSEPTTPHSFPSGGRLGRAAGTAAIGLLGLSGPAGWGVVAAGSIGGWLIGQRMKRKLNGAGGRRKRRFQTRG